MKKILLVVGLLIAGIVLSGCVKEDVPKDSNVSGPAKTAEADEVLPKNMLIIGMPSTFMLVSLNEILAEDENFIRHHGRTEFDLEINPGEQLKEYDIVMLDQHSQANKEISKELGDAIVKYVNEGGKLIVVMDSGIRRKDAADVIGWEATLGEIVPVSCDSSESGYPSCLERKTIIGKIHRQDDKHKIMKDILVVPEDPEARGIMLEVLNVASKGNEIAYVLDSRTPAFYTGIVEAKLTKGNVIYFNYDPGITKDIFKATLEYLKEK